MRNATWTSALLLSLALMTGGDHRSLAAEADFRAQSASRPKTVLELFTSQGCSSCPPADALLERFIRRDDVIALSVPVDYWDRLGWKDTFASRDNSNRQRDYAVGRGDGQVYTPQVVINGRAHAVGSSAGQIESAIAWTAKARGETNVPIRLQLSGETLVVEAGGSSAGLRDATGTLFVAAIQDHGKVTIGRGENAGRTVTYFNVVRSMKPMASWNGGPITVRLPRKELLCPECQAVAVLLQQGRGGPIIGAAQVRLATTAER